MSAGSPFAVAGADFFRFPLSSNSDWCTKRTLVLEAMLISISFFLPLISTTSIEKVLPSQPLVIRPLILLGYATRAAPLGGLLNSGSAFSLLESFFGGSDF